MRVEMHSTPGELALAFLPEDNDKSVLKRPDGSQFDTLFRKSCRFLMPEDWSRLACHPDLLAAVIVSVCSSISMRRLELPFGVSKEFSERIQSHYRFQMGPVDPQLESRARPADGRPGLCFSGGVDSAVALMLGPQDTVPVFLERIDPPDGGFWGMYHLDAPLRACRVLAAAGRQVRVVKTDMEFLRKPVGFSNDLTMAAPLILLADHLKLDSIVYGLIMESAYLTKGMKYRVYPESGHFKRYNGIAAAVGLPFNLVTAGLSEVVTTRLAMESPVYHFAQSCTRGAFSQPCQICWKCFRKNLLEAAVAGEVLPDHVLQRYFRMPKVRKELYQDPVKHENVLAYIAQRYHGDNQEMRALQQRLGTQSLDLTWTTRWLPRSREVIDVKYRSEVEANITRLVPAMTERDQAAVEAWDRLPATSR